MEKVQYITKCSNFTMDQYNIRKNRDSTVLKTYSANMSFYFNSHSFPEQRDNQFLFQKFTPIYPLT